ncbi:MAG: ABC transporter permease [Myxococcales bacterium]|nr:MAG: ABC transporter permease [Myxococcales bacterium]
MNANLCTVQVLWQRELLRFVKEKSRIVGALLQPLLLWGLFGVGMGSVFSAPGNNQMNYMEFFFPGVLVMMLLFSSIFATMSLIEDRHEGLLHSILVAPGSRGAIVLGKSFGASSVAIVQSILFLGLAPLAGLKLSTIDWPMLFSTLVWGSLLLSFIGFAVAWLLDSTQGYHVIMSVLLIPLWVLSGAMFPVPAFLIQSKIAFLNPMTFISDHMRRALYGGQMPEGFTALVSNPSLELAVLIIATVLAFFIAHWACRVKR